MLRNDTFPVLYRYIAISVAIFTICLFPTISVLRRRQSHTTKGYLNEALLGNAGRNSGGDVTIASSAERASSFSTMLPTGFRSRSSRGAVPVAPAVFHRNTSITQTKSVTAASSNSITGELHCYTPDNSFLSDIVILVSFDIFRDTLSVNPFGISV